MRTHRALPAVALLAASGLALAGCATVEAVAYGFADADYPDRAALKEGAAIDADWVPADATEVRVRTSTRTDAPDAVVAVRSAADLDGCVTTDRLSAPSWYLEDAPDVYAADTVWACGDWSVVASEDGWYGWTPNHADERAAAAGAVG